jgi:hypothetical protein
MRAALRHHLDREAALEIGRRFELLEGRLLRGEKRGDKRLVLGFVERAVDVVRAAPARPCFVIARLAPAHAHVDGFGMDDGRDRVEEGKLGFAGQGLDGIRQRRRGEGTRRHDDAVPVGRRQARDLLARNFDQQMGFERPGDKGGEAVAIDRERGAGRQLVRVGRRHDERGGSPHLLVKQADGVGFPIVGAKGIGANELGECSGLVRLGRTLRPHLVQYGGHAALCELPGGLASGQAAANDMNLADHDC